MSGNIFVISDTHFGHAKVINFCNRPFTDVQHMEESLIESWNNTVSKRDVVLILGDFAWTGKDFLVAKKLQGYKRLIMGNHDISNIHTLSTLFQSVHSSFTRNGILFTHIPIIFDKYHHWDYIVHGHIHNKNQNINDWRYYNANMDAIQIYKPIPLEDIEKEFRARKLNQIMDGYYE